MRRQIAAALLLGSALMPSLARADSWTEGQAEWARHGSRHGAWDCNGQCPAGRRAAPAPATLRRSLACQRNIDGRTLISDATVLPAGAKSRIVSYHALRRVADWSYGTCMVEVSR